MSVNEELFFSGSSVYENDRFSKLNDFFNYFRDKDKLYRKIYRLLLENKTEIENTTSKEFAKDIIELFSLKNTKEKIKDFTFFKNRYAKQFFNEMNFPLKDSKDLYLSKFYIPQEFVSSVAHLYLSKNNLLKIYFNMEDYFIRRKKILKDIANNKGLKNSLRREKAFDRFLDENFNNWLKSIISMADFETKICKKIKTKILINQM